ncbi:MAG: DUF523 and DUF1722 domain-containing protein [Vicinamibacterales bacterium]
MVRIGVSRCLLGDPVRGDGAYERDAYLADVFGRHVSWVPVCPEVESGLPDLDAERLDGFVFTPARRGRGLFADAVVREMPLLPVEEEGHLADPRLRENFIERVFAYARLRAVFEGRWTIGALVRFHTAHKLTLLAHKPAAYRALGTLVAGAKGRGRAAVRDEYRSVFMAAMATVATPARHVNVMQHMVGYLRDVADAEVLVEIRGLVDDYRQGHVPLIVPLTRLGHCIRRHRIEYLMGQTYLDPYPRELALRNHV